MFCSDCTSTSVNTNQTPCIQKPLSKTALFVIGMLFAGGAAGSYFLYGNIPGIVAFSLAGGVSFLAFALSWIGTKPVEEVESDSSEDLTKPAALPAYDERAEAAIERGRAFASQVARTAAMAPEDLMVEIGADANNTAAQFTLSKKIAEFFEFSTYQSPVDVAQQILPLILAAGSDHKSLYQLVKIVLGSSPINYALEVLEAVKWPDEATKQKMLSVALVNQLLTLFDTAPVELGIIPTWHIVLDMEAILGTHGNQLLSATLLHGIAQAIYLYADAQLVKDSDVIGFVFEISQTEECPVSTAVIAPLLPFLNDVPGLVGIKLLNLEGAGFTNDDAPTLLQLFGTNHHLRYLEVNDAGMDLATQTKFRTDLKQLMAWRNAHPATQEAILAEYF